MTEKSRGEQPEPEWLEIDVRVANAFAISLEKRAAMERMTSRDDMARCLIAWMATPKLADIAFSPGPMRDVACAVEAREREAFARGMREAAKIVEAMNDKSDKAFAIRAWAEEGSECRRCATVFVNGSEVPTKINGSLHLERNLDECDARKKRYVLSRLCDDLLDHMGEIQLGTVTLHLNGPLISWTATKKQNPTGAAQ